MRNRRSKRKKEKDRPKTRPKLKCLPINRCLICGHLLEHTRRQVEIIPFCWGCRNEARQRGMSSWELLKEKQKKEKWPEEKILEEIAEFEARTEEKWELADKIDEMLEWVDTPMLSCSFQNLLSKQRELQGLTAPGAPVVSSYELGETREAKKLSPGRNRFFLFWVNFWVKVKKGLA